MAISAVHSGYQILNQSEKMADEAAREINIEKEISPVGKADQALSFNKIEYTRPPEKPPQVDSLVKLNQATQYNRIGTNVIQRDQDMIGSLLDIQV
ncbi:hypothetical protein P4S52_16135 [Vibrio sp. SA48]|uniref:hypothetical protein n=1 Tax=Vibrio sp. S12_S33 TaxID=2720223 RepID=UPI0017821381|nr:hypothetical protein [Vibrio sp. S12_S33]MBD1566399.1 hypothetical protein [Vibrio sp. S12_S33]